MLNIKTDLWDIGWGTGTWIDFTQDRVQWRAYVTAVMNLRVNWKKSKLEVDL